MDVSPPSLVTDPACLCAPGIDARACRSPAAIEYRLRHGQLSIVESEALGMGSQGARRLVLATSVAGDHVVLHAKWRAYSTRNAQNDPRSELLAHEVQKLFLPPERWVVPPAVGRCFPLAAYRSAVEPSANATFDGTACVWGVLSYWLEDALDLDAAEDADWLSSDATLLDAEAFRRKETYRRSLADVNLLAHLISHGDSHNHQFVFTGSRAHPRVYLVDNSIAFSDYRNPRLDSVGHWADIRVPGLAGASIERLRRVTERDVRDLVTVEAYRNRSGMLWPVPPSRTLERVRATRGVRVNGDFLEVGLTTAEAELVWNRIRALIERIDHGEIETF